MRIKHFIRAELVEAMRRERGLSREQLAVRAGISAATLSSAVRGAAVSLRTLHGIATALGVDFGQVVLFAETESPGTVVATSQEAVA